MIGQRLSEALAAAGAVLKRRKKHLVYALPNGKTLTVSATPSDHCAERNQLSDLRHALGLEPRAAVVHPPRSKTLKPGRQSREEWPSPRSTSPLADALRGSGVYAQAELAKAREVERDLRWRLLRLEVELGAVRQQLTDTESLWVVRAWKAIRRLRTRHDR